MGNPAPFNVRIFDPDDYIQRRNCLPVTAHSIYESSSDRFNPDGFFSEVIFGQVGSPDRLVRRGYIDLRTRVVTPHLYKQIMTLKGFYQDICAGKTYAVYDPDLKDLVRVPKTDPNGRSGYSFFLEMLPKIKFAKNDSDKRNLKIDLIEEYKDELFMTKMIVVSAGVRDIKENNGRPQIEKINKLYFSLLSLAQAMPDTLTEDPVYDAIRFQMQMKIQAIYMYIADMLEGKGGFIQSKYAARNVVYSNRNVITAVQLTKSPSPDSPAMFSVDEVMVPMYQFMKGCVPLMVNRFKTLFFDPVFGTQSTQIPVINKQTYRVEYREISPQEMRKFTTSEGITDILNEYRNKELHFKPVIINLTQPGSKQVDYGYLYLVYDAGDVIYTFRDKEDFLSTYSRRDQYTVEGIPNLDRVSAWNPDDFVILGSTALSVFGMPHYNQDIDVVVNDELMEVIRKDPNYEKQPNGVYRRKDGGIDVYNDLILTKKKDEGPTFHDYKNGALHIGPYWFDNPGHLLKTYQKSNRPKDRNKIKYLESIVVDMDKIRPMTYVEMGYIAAYSAARKTRCTSTRHPVINLMGIQVFKPHLASTTDSRVVELRSPGTPLDGVQLPEYPIIGSSVKTTMSMHPSSLEGFSGDHDGDVLGLNVIMSTDACQEIDEYLSSVRSIVDTSGHLMQGLGTTRSIKYSFYCTTCGKLPQKEK